MTALVTTVSVALSLLGFDRTCRLLGVRQSVPASPDVEDVLKRHVTAMLRVKLHAEWTGKCLSRALALRYALARRGMAAQVHVGVSSLSPFSAHAWVVSNGVALGERHDMLAAYPATFVIG